MNVSKAIVERIKRDNMMPENNIIDVIYNVSNNSMMKIKGNNNVNNNTLNNNSIDNDVFDDSNYNKTVLYSIYIKSIIESNRSLSNMYYKNIEHYKTVKSFTLMLINKCILDTLNTDNIKSILERKINSDRILSKNLRSISNMNLFQSSVYNLLSSVSFTSSDNIILEMDNIPVHESNVSNMNLCRLLCDNDQISVTELYRQTNCTHIDTNILSNTKVLIDMIHKLMHENTRLKSYMLTRSNHGCKCYNDVMDMLNETESMS